MAGTSARRAGLEQGPGAAHVGLEGRRRVGHRRPDQGLGGEVEDDVELAGVERGADPPGVAEVGLDQLDLGCDPLQGQSRERRRRQVEDGDRVAALEQGPGQVRGDEAVAAGDQRPLHGASAAAASQTRQGASPLAQRSFSTTASL